MLGQHRGKPGQIGRIIFFVLHHGGMVVRGFDRFNQFISRPTFDQVFGIDQGFPGVLDIGGCKRLTVTPLDALFQPIGDGQAVLGHTAVCHAGYFFRQNGDVFALVVDIDQVLGKGFMYISYDGLHPDVSVEGFRFLINAQRHDFFGRISRW